jgi:carbon monoxide dehydrogenase subunit G
VDGREIPTTAVAAQDHGGIIYQASLPEAVPRPGVIAIHVTAPADSHAGDALPEPVAFTCGPGLMPAGDWCGHGLATYSGVVDYQKSIRLTNVGPAHPVHLDLGVVAATAEVRVNGNSVAILTAPPWNCDLTPFLRPGENQLSIRVANTLANHYSVGIPTPYAFPHQTAAGLLGPVALTFAGTARFEELDEAVHTARVKAQGTDQKGRGGANAVARFALSAVPGGTRVDIATDVNLSGAVAQYGRGAGIIQAVAAELIGQFAEALRAMIARDAPPPTEAPSAAPVAPPPPPAAAPIGGFGLIWRVMLGWLRSLFGRG